MFLWWYAMLVVFVGYAALRGVSDNLGMPVHSSGIEETLFGTLPAIRLQAAIYSRWPQPTEWASVAIHSSWFIVPFIAAAWVSWKKPERIGSFFRWWIAVQALGVMCFMLFPLEPPWMASSDVVRLNALRLGGQIPDSNQLAAMPSLHVALPLVIALWFTKERWIYPAAVMFAYALFVAGEVVVSGEHYVVDAMGAGLVALTVAWGSGIDASSVRRWVRDWAAPVASGSGRQPAGQFSPVRSEGRAQ